MSAPFTVEQVLQLHPWPKEHAATPRLEWLWHFEVPLAVERLWPFIADSSRMNRSLGVAEMKFHDDGTVRRGSSKPAGVLHEWVEVPWKWVAGQWMESVRLYDKGFSKVVYGVFHLTPLDALRTRVSVYFGAIPSGLVGRLALKFGFPALEKDFQRVFKELAEQVQALQPVFALPPREALSADAEARLVEVKRQLVLDGLDGALIDRLFDFIRTGDELDLFRMQVRALARQWVVNEQELLRVALHSTRAGILDISRDLICPPRPRPPQRRRHAREPQRQRPLRRLRNRLRQQHARVGRNHLPRAPLDSPGRAPHVLQRRARHEGPHSRAARASARQDDGAPADVERGALAAAAARSEGIRVARHRRER